MLSQRPAPSSLSTRGRGVNRRLLFAYARPSRLLGMQKEHQASLGSAGPCWSAAGDDAQPPLFRIQDELLSELQTVAFKGSLQPARTKYSDEKGVYRAVDPVQGQTSWTVCTYSSPIGGSWAYTSRTFDAATGLDRVTKTGADPQDLRLLATPRLDVEVVAFPGFFLLYAAMTPRVNLSTHPEYVRYYYLSVPRLDAEGGEASDASRGGVGHTPEHQLLSYERLEERCRADSRYTPFVSPNIWTRTLAGSALCYKLPRSNEVAADEDSLRLIKRDVLAIARLWLAFLHRDVQQASVLLGEEPAIESIQPPRKLMYCGQVLQGSAAAELAREIAQMKAAVRQEADPDFPRGVKLWGAAAMEQAAAMAGDARL